MIVAVIWPADSTATPRKEDDARKTGRYIAAAGHALMVAPSDRLSRTTAEAYRAAGGEHLIGFTNESGFGAGVARPYDKTIQSTPGGDIPEKVFQMANTFLFMDAIPEDEGWAGRISKTEKPVYLIPDEKAPEHTENSEARYHVLAGVDDFARELARSFSRRIISRPDPMKEKFKRAPSS